MPRQQYIIDAIGERKYDNGDNSNNNSKRWKTKPSHSPLSFCLYEERENPGRRGVKLSRMMGESSVKENGIGS